MISSKIYEKKPFITLEDLIMTINGKKGWF